MQDATYISSLCRNFFCGLGSMAETAKESDRALLQPFLFFKTEELFALILF